MTDQDKKTEDAQSHKDWEAAADAQPEAAESEMDERGEDITADEAALFKDRWIRAEAELKNVRRRAEKDRQDAASYAITQFARDLLTVADYLRMALDSMPEEVRDDPQVKTFVTGVEMTEKELLSGFERHGIKKVVPEGAPFDPKFHQAMTEVEVQDVAPGHVAQVIKPGYVLKERLLRAAMVAVARPPSENGPEEEGSQGTSGIDQQV